MAYDGGAEALRAVGGGCGGEEDVVVFSVGREAFGFGGIG